MSEPVEKTSMETAVHLVWEKSGDEPQCVAADVLAKRVLELAQRFDAATATLVTLPGGDALARRDATSDVPYLVGQSAQLVVLVCRLRSRVQLAVQHRDTVVAQVGRLHDPKSPDAALVLRDVNQQLSLMQEALDKQVRKLDSSVNQLSRLVASREQEARAAEKRAADRAALAETESTLEALRKLANESAVLIRQDRLGE